MASRAIYKRSPAFFARTVHQYPTAPIAHFRCVSTRSTIPRIVEPSIWSSVIPKFLRRGWRDPEQKASQKKREWNPATYFIIMFLLIGSQALRMVQLKNDYGNYVRSTEAKIRVFREVIERLQKGEDVDVSKMLGTGDEVAEREWEEVLAEIAQEKLSLGNDSKSHQALSNQKPEPEKGGSPKITTSFEPDMADIQESKPKRAAKFY